MAAHHCSTTCPRSSKSASGSGPVARLTPPPASAHDMDRSYKHGAKVQPQHRAKSRDERGLASAGAKQASVYRRTHARAQFTDSEPNACNQALGTFLSMNLNVFDVALLEILAMLHALATLNPSHHCEVGMHVLRARSEHRLQLGVLPNAKTSVAPVWMPCV